MVVNKVPTTDYITSINNLHISVKEFVFPNIFRQLICDIDWILYSFKEGSIQSLTLYFKTQIGVKVVKGCTPLEYIFITPELLEVLRWNFWPVNGISLQIYVGLRHIPLQLLPRHKWFSLKKPIQTLQTNYFVFQTDLLVSRVWDMFWSWNLLKNVFLIKEVKYVTFSFCWY